MDEGWNNEKLTEKEKKKLYSYFTTIIQNKKPNEESVKKMNIVLKERENNINNINKIINKLSTKNIKKPSENDIFEKFGKDEFKGFKMIDPSKIQKGSIIKYVDINNEKIYPASIFVGAEYTKLIKHKLLDIDTINKNLSKLNINKYKKLDPELENLFLEDIGQNIYEPKQYIISIALTSVDNINKIYWRVVPQKYIFFVQKERKNKKENKLKDELKDELKEILKKPIVKKPIVKVPKDKKK